MASRRKQAAREAIGERLRLLRQTIGWSQNELARRTDLRRTEISVIEAGRNTGWSWRVQTLLCQGFGVPKQVLDQYFGGELPVSAVAQLVTARSEHNGAPEPKAERARPVRPPEPAPSKAAAAAELPKLRLAVDLLAEDSGVDREFLDVMAHNVASLVERPADRETLQWVRELQTRLGQLRSEVQTNPMRIPNLAEAVRILLKEQPLAEPKLKTAAARLVSDTSDPLSASTAFWFRLLDRELTEAPASHHPEEARASSAGRAADRAAVRKRTAKVGRRR